MDRNRLIPIIFLAIAALLWSSAGLLIKLVPWNPLAIAGIRSGIATLVLLAFWRWDTGRWLPPITMYKFLAGLNYMILVSFFVIANKLTTSANAILLQFTAPIWVLLLSVWILKEKVTRKDMLVVLVVFAGMTLFFVGDLGQGGMLGNIFAVVSGVAMAFMIISMKKIKNGSPLEIIIWGNIFTFILGIPFYSEITLSSQSVMGISFLGVFQLGLAYIFFTKGLARVSALEGILVPVLEPLLNPVWVLLGTGEVPTPYALAGGAIVVSAVLYRSISNALAEQGGARNPAVLPEAAKTI